MANGGDGNAGRTFLNAARAHPLFTSIALLAVVANLVLSYLQLLEPVAAGLGILAVLGLVIVAALAERAYYDIVQVGAIQVARPVYVIVWVFTVLLCTASTCLLMLAIAHVARREFRDSLAPPEYGTQSIPLTVATRLTDTGILKIPATLKTGTPGYQSLITMNQFWEDLEPALSPTLDAKNKRLAFAMSTSGFSPPYRSMVGHIVAEPYKVERGAAFLFSEEPGGAPGAPVRRARQIPLRIEPDGSNTLNIVNPSVGERILLMLQLAANPETDISANQTFPLAIAVEQN